jgi:hypothetical protein
MIIASQFGVNDFANPSVKLPLNEVKAARSCWRPIATLSDGGQRRQTALQAYADLRFTLRSGFIIRPHYSSIDAPFKVFCPKNHAILAGTTRMGVVTFLVKVAVPGNQLGETWFHAYSQTSIPSINTGFRQFHRQCTGAC